MLNSGLRGKRTKDSKGIVSVADQFNQQQYLIPTVTSFSITDESYVPLDDEAVDSAGGQTIVINGSGFAPGATVTVGGDTISVVTYIDSGRLAFTAPAKISGSYTIFVTNATGGTGILVPGLVYSGVPTFYTAAGSLGTLYETTSINKLVEASGDEPITYSLSSGSLPSGATLNSDGTITGTSPVDSGSTTYSFTIKATDVENQDSLRSFSLTINTDVVTWSSPASEQSYSLAGGSAISAVTLSATSAAGYDVQYVANTLPTGLSLSGNSITGTPTVAETIYTQLTATANTTGRSATRTISWTISLGDSNWKYVSLLLNGATSSPSFINDASLNNSQLTIVGETRPNNFNPYTDGYYSNYFDGNGDYLAVLTNSAFNIGTNSFTVESWINTSSATQQTIFNISDTSSLGYGAVRVQVLADKTVQWLMGPGGSWGVARTAGSITLGTWNHIAITRDGSSVRFFINGQQVDTTQSYGSSLASGGTSYIGFNSGTGYAFNGYISNFRFVNGSALYTTNFTPSTTPLEVVETTGLANTSLLTCQSNSLIDNSINNFTISKGGDVVVKSAHPFSTVYQVNQQKYSTLFNDTDYATTPDNSTTDILGSAGLTSNMSLTIECWVYLLNSNNFLKCLVGAVTQSSYSYDWFFGFDDTSENKLLMSWAGTGGGTCVGTTQVPIKTWTHVAVSISNGSIKLFVNGNQETVTGPTSLGTSSTTFNKLTIGGFVVPSSKSAIISNLRIVRGALYTANFTPSTTRLTAITNTGLLTCQDSTFKDNSTNNLKITPATTTTKPLAVSPFTLNRYTDTKIETYGSTYFFDQGATTDYLTIPHTPALNLSSGDFTIEAWIYRNELTGNLGNIISKDGRPTVSYNSYQFSLSFGSFYALTFRVGNGGTTTAPQTIASSTALPLGQWVHAAVVKNGTNISIYQNGVRVADVTQTTAIVDAGQPVYIGMDQGQNSASNWSGYISDLRVIKGTALYTDKFTPPTAPVSPVANTQLLTCQTNGGATNNAFVDQSSYNNIITRNGNPTQGTFSPYSQNHWSNYYPALAYSTYAANPISTFGTGATFTVEGWVNMSVYPATNYHFTLLSSCNQSTALYWAIGVGSTGKATVYWYDGNVKQCLGSTTLNKGTWYHVAIVVTSGVVTMYVDGVAETLTGTTSLTNPTGNASYTTGTERGSSNGGSIGYISNLRTSTSAVYTTPFTPSLVPLVPAITSSVYATLLTAQDNSFIDNSPSNRTITTSNAQVQTYSPFGGITTLPNSYSNYFDGNGDFLSVPDNAAFDFTGDFTLEAWVYPLAYGTDNAVLCQWTAGLNFIFKVVSGNRLYFAGYPGASTVIVQGTSTTVNLNQWNHVAVTRSGTTIRLFVNGQLDSTTGNMVGTMSGTDPVTIGSLGTTQYWNGYISNARIIKGTALYTENFTPSVTALTAVSGTSLLTCQSSTMIDNSTNNFTITSNGDTKPKPFNPFGTTTTTGVGYTPSVNGGSMYFDGTGDFLTAGTFPAGTNNFTVEAWIYPTAAPASQGEIYCTPWGGSNFQLMLNSNMTVQWQAYTQSQTTKPAIRLNEWTHVAVVKNGSNAYTYINGVLRDTTALSINISGTAYVGSRAADALYFIGHISDLRVNIGSALYTSNFYPGYTPLTPTTRIGANNYSSLLLLNGTTGGIVDSHGTNVLETVGNTTLASEDPYGGSYYSNYFDGTGDYLDVGTPMSLAGDFTIEMWIKPNLVTKTYSEFFTSASANFELLLNSDTLSLWTVVSHQTPVTAGVWHHVALTRSGSTIYLYLDGVRSTSSGTSSTTFTPYRIGTYAGSENFPGFISNLRVVSGSVLYSGTTITVPTAPLAAVSGTQLLTCQSNRFRDNSTNNYGITVAGDTKVKSVNPFQNNTGKSLYFDGTDDYLTTKKLAVPDLDLVTGDFTIECWVYNAGSGAERYILSQRGSSSGWELRINSTNLIQFFFTSGSTLTSTSVIPPNQWTHISVTRSVNSLKIYINGTLDATNDSFTNGTSAASAYPVYIGNSTSAGGGLFLGYMEDLRITKGVVRTITVPSISYQVK